MVVNPSVRTVVEPVSRNASCPCGSGLRYKHCHGRPTAPVVEAVSAIAEAQFHLGNLARQAGNHRDAITHYEAALRHVPGHAGVLNNLGLALEAEGAMEDAGHRFEQALASTPFGLEPLANLAQNLYQRKRYSAAIRHFDRLVAGFDIRSASIWSSRGICHARLGNLVEAERSMAHALDFESSASLHRDLGFIRIELRRYAQAAAAFEQALKLDPDSALAQSALLVCRLYGADWREFDTLRDRVISAAGRLGPPSHDSIVPFGFMTICDDPALQQRVAVRLSSENHDDVETPPPPRRNPKRLRLGLAAIELSAEHPVSRLVVELIERLDRKRFDVSFFAVGRAADESWRARFEGAFDRFVSIPALDPDDGAGTIRGDDVDILIDLDGNTGRGLADLFARRPAPMQVNFLGYTGTLGSSAYDYLIADRHCVPEEDHAHYTERILYVDPCYLPCDTKRAVGGPALDRATYGLPAGATVLCAFPNTYKILPAMFACWMRLLAGAPEAVLWLRHAGDEANARLCVAARDAGVDPARLVFARDEAIERYLARFSLADLFVDTAPFGAHTTVNDALWQGLPVLTTDGRSFAARASASQVLAAGLPELVARDLAHYEAIAAGLLADPARLRELTERLRASRATSRLFDMSAYAQAFGDALETGWTRLEEAR